MSLEAVHWNDTGVVFAYAPFAGDERVKAAGVEVSTRKEESPAVVVFPAASETTTRQ